MDFLERRLKHFDLSFETRNAIHKLKKISDVENFALLFVVFPQLYNGSQYECEWIIQQCKKHGIAYIDLRETYERAGYENLIINASTQWHPQRVDTCHPNKLGHRLAAEAIYEYFEKAIIKRNHDVDYSESH